MSDSDKSSRHEPGSEKTGYDASDIIADALDLAVDDELKEAPEDTTSENGHSSKVNCQKYAEDSTSEKRTVLLSPPKPESAPVVAPLTIEDKIAMDTSKDRNADTDDTSMIVNLDDSQNEILDGDEDVSDSLLNGSDNKSTRKSNSDNNNGSDSKSDSNAYNKDNEEPNSSAKDLSKNTEKETTKSKSANHKESKIKTKESKTGPVTQKGQVNIARNIWVSGLSQNAKACELQTIFAKQGKVVSAKIIKNAKMSGSRCFGFITMENSDQVAKCISQLNKTELHGKTISLSRNRPQESSSKVSIVRPKPNVTKKDVIKVSGKTSDTKANDNEIKAEEKKEESKRKSEEKSANRSVSESGSSKDIDPKFHEKRKPIRAPMRDRPHFIPRRNIIPPFRRPIPLRRPFPPPFSIRGFHRGGLTRGGFRPHMLMRPRPDLERTFRDRERERRFREERRHEEFLKVEEREERIRLEREKEKIRLERMKLEREKLEWFKAERERARLERERIEREREELKRRQQPQPVFAHRVEDSRSRPPMLSSSLGKRPFDTRDMRPNDNYWEERKRIQQLQRIDSHIEPSRQTFVDSSSSVGNRHSIPHSYDSRNDSYKRNSRFEAPMTGNRSEFEARRHDSRHGMGHDRDDRKTGPTYYRGESRNTFPSRDRRFPGTQREDWKTSHDSRRSDRYGDKPLGGSSTGFSSTSRYGTDSRNWSERSNSYGSGPIHMSTGQQWTPSSGGRWNSAINSNESRSRGQPNLSSSVISSGSHAMSDLFVSTPMSGLNMNVSHSMGGPNSLGSGERTYIHHNNRRF